MVQRVLGGSKRCNTPPAQISYQSGMVVVYSKRDSPGIVRKRTTLDYLFGDAPLTRRYHKKLQRLQEGENLY